MIVGAGQVTEMFYLPALRTLGWSVVLIDVDIARARSLAKRYGARADGLPALRTAISPDDVVVVATPPRTHAQLVSDCLSAGARRILVEKPPFVTSRELQDGIERGRTANALVGAAFVRRAWPSTLVAKDEFSSWTRSLGSLKAVSIAEGQPWGWASVATRKAASRGLEHMVLDELPHALDSLYFIAGWHGSEVRPSCAKGFSSSPWSVSGSTTLHLSGGDSVELGILGSRREVLANSIKFSFERGVAHVELSPSGGVVVRDLTRNATSLYRGGEPSDFREVIGRLLRGVAGDDRGAALFADVGDWRGPLALIEALQAAEQPQSGEPKR